MIVVETPIFTKRICDLSSDDDVRRLQWALLLRPEQGPLIPGGADRVYLIYAYDKLVQADMTKSQVRKLARLVREELK